MRESRCHLLFVLFLAIGISHCNGTNGGDICPDGYEYDSTLDACIALSDTDVENNDKTDVSSDEPDASADDEEEKVDDGIGDECTEHSQCTKAADFCGVNPFSGTGYCTYQNCTETSCPKNYNCCECSLIDVPVCGSYDNADIQELCFCSPPAP